VQARLAQDELELQREIDALHEELKRDQDPSRMQLIQETISVWLLRPRSYPLPSLKLRRVGITRADVSYPRKGDRVRGCSEKYHKGHTSPRLGEKESHTEHDDAEAAANVGHVNYFLQLGFVA
jgi:hypothetical protein